MAVKTKGLGKGLDILIPETVMKDNNPKVIEKVVEKPVEIKIKLSKIEPNRDQPRKNFEEDALLELSDSIKQFGIIQPLVVQEREGFYEIIAGERRWRAAKLAGLREVPVIIKKYNEQEILEISLIENIQRENLNPIEEALAYKKLIHHFNLKQDEIAERVSKSRTAVTNSLRLLKLDDRVQQMVIDDKISTGHARTLIVIEDNDLQYHLANRIFDEKLSVRETEKLIKKIISEKVDSTVKKETSNHDFIFRNIEDKITSIVGTKVKINQKSNNKGKIEIEFYSNDELERIFDLIQSIES